MTIPSSTEYGDRNAHSSVCAGRGRSLSHLKGIYEKARTAARRSVVVERMLSLALSGHPECEPAIRHLKRLGIHVALMPSGVTVGFRGAAAD